MEELPLQSLMIKRNDRMPTPHKTFEKVLSKLEAIVHISNKEIRYAMFRRWKEDKELNLESIFEAGKKAWYEETKFIPIDPALEVIKKGGIKNPDLKFGVFKKWHG